jgi:Glycosyl transferase family 64 domain
MGVTTTPADYIPNDRGLPSTRLRRLRPPRRKTLLPQHARFSNSSTSSSTGTSSATATAAAEAGVTVVGGWPNTDQWDLDRLIARFALRVVVPFLLLNVLASAFDLLFHADHHLHHHSHHGGGGSSYMERQMIPLPSSDIQVSAIVMNHDRPYLLKHSTLLRTLAAHPSIQKVFVLHSKPDTAFDNTALKHQLDDVQREKVTHLDVHDRDRDIGLALRFHYCADEAQLYNMTEYVMIVDDDMELDRSGVSELILEMEKNPKRIVGHYGRAYNHYDVLGRHGYSTRNVYGNVEVVLTKIMILEQRICRAFGQYRDIMADFVVESTPKWNGEDIFVSLVANRIYNVPVNGPFRNYAIPNLPVWEADEASFLDEISVSGNMDRTTPWKDGLHSWWKNVMKAQVHTNYRGRLWQTAKRRLFVSPQHPQQKQPQKLQQLHPQQPQKQQPQKLQQHLRQTTSRGESDS